MSYGNRYAKPYQRPLGNGVSGPRQIVAKFPSVCRECGGAIAIGDAILWAPGSPAKHVECPAQPALPIPAASPAPRLEVEDAGVYVLPDGRIVKVQANREKTRVYTKVWKSSHQDRLMEAGQHEHGDYVYAPELLPIVQATGRRMTLAEAKEWSVRVGRCIRCGRTLIDGTSVERALGPVCVRFFEGA